MSSQHLSEYGYSLNDDGTIAIWLDDAPPYVVRRPLFGEYRVFWEWLPDPSLFTAIQLRDRHRDWVQRVISVLAPAIADELPASLDDIRVTSEWLLHWRSTPYGPWSGVRRFAKREGDGGMNPTFDKWTHGLMFGPVYKAMAGLGISAKDTDQTELWQIAWSISADEMPDAENLKKIREEEGFDKIRQAIEDRAAGREIVFDPTATAVPVGMDGLFSMFDDDEVDGLDSETTDTGGPAV